MERGANLVACTLSQRVSGHCCCPSPPSSVLCAVARAGTGGQGELTHNSQHSFTPIPCVSSQGNCCQDRLQCKVLQQWMSHAAKSRGVRTASAMSVQPAAAPDSPPRQKVLQMVQEFLVLISFFDTGTRQCRAMTGF